MILMPMNRVYISTGTLDQGSWTSPFLNRPNHRLADEVHGIAVLRLKENLEVVSTGHGENRYLSPPDDPAYVSVEIHQSPNGIADFTVPVRFLIVQHRDERPQAELLDYLSDGWFARKINNPIQLPQVGVAKSGMDAFHVCVIVIVVKLLFEGGVEGEFAIQDCFDKRLRIGLIAHGNVFLSEGLAFTR